VAKAKDVRELQEAGVKDLRAELNVLRSQSSQLSLEKDALVERLKKLSETIKNQARVIPAFAAVGDEASLFSSPVFHERVVLCRS
jgi:hypothetical protein